MRKLLIASTRVFTKISLDTNQLIRTNRNYSLQSKLRVVTSCQIQNFTVIRSKMTDSTIKSEDKNGFEQFALQDYDVIGFDLDNTLLRYKVTEMMVMIYEKLAEFLIEVKGYSKKHLSKPMGDDLDFLQKGLILDFNRGNVLRICPNGSIQIASHGTRILSEEEVVKYYGKSKRWYVTDEYAKCMLNAWNGELAEQIRTTLDYFDMPAALIFARVIDSIDEEKGTPQEKYNVWPDILEGIMGLYNRDFFSSITPKSPYFESMKANPDKFIHKTSEVTLKWLKDLKKKKATFLLTGSHIDFASFTAGFALGPDWRDYFDIVVCYAKKPGFFTLSRPFLELDGIKETTVVETHLKDNTVYTQGNIAQLRTFFENLTKKDNMKLLYLGDNLIQDVYTPKKYSDCDTIAIVEEMWAEGPDYDPNYKILRSNLWGSYFHFDGKATLWSEIIKKYSKICIPSVDVIAKNPMDYKYKAFTKEDSSSGYYPHDPNF